MSFALKNSTFSYAHVHFQLFFHLYLQINFIQSLINWFNDFSIFASYEV